MTDDGFLVVYRSGGGWVPLLRDTYGALKSARSAAQAFADVNGCSTRVIRVVSMHEPGRSSR